MDLKTPIRIIKERHGKIQVSKEIIEKIRKAEAEADEIRRSAAQKADELRAKAEAEAAGILAEARAAGEAKLGESRREQDAAAVRAAEEGKKVGAYEAARATAEASDNFEAAVSRIIGGLTE